MTELPAWLQRAEREPPRPAAPNERTLLYAAVEHHEQQLARTADAEATWPDGARVRGDRVDVLSGGRVLARYRWAWRLAWRGSERRWVLGFEAVS